MSENNQTNKAEERSCTGSECSDLLSCPFCGQEAELAEDDNDVYVCCHDCGAMGEQYFWKSTNAKERAVKSWNTRAR